MDVDKQEEGMWRGGGDGVEEGREGRAFLSRKFSMLRASPVKGIESSVQGEVCGELRMRRAERGLVR